VRKPARLFNFLDFQFLVFFAKCSEKVLCEKIGAFAYDYLNGSGQLQRLGAEQSPTGGCNACDGVVTGFIVALIDVAAQTGSAFIDRGSLFPVPQPATPVHPTPPHVGP